MEYSVNINTETGGNEYLCNVKNSEVEKLLETISNHLKYEYGENDVILEEQEINTEMKINFPAMKILYKFTCNTLSHSYIVWVEFNNQKLEDTNKNLRRLKI